MGKGHAADFDDANAPLQLNGGCQRLGRELALRGVGHETFGANVNHMPAVQASASGKVKLNPVSLP
jgi:hypothetical protein